MKKLLLCFTILLSFCTASFAQESPTAKQVQKAAILKNKNAAKQVQVVHPPMNKVPKEDPNVRVLTRASEAARKKALTTQL